MGATEYKELVHWLDDVLREDNKKSYDFYNTIHQKIYGTGLDSDVDDKDIGTDTSEEDESLPFCKGCLCRYCYDSVLCERCKCDDCWDGSHYKVECVSYKTK